MTDIQGLQKLQKSKKIYIRKRHTGILDSGRKSWTLDTGRWTLETGFWTLDPGR